MKFLPLLFLVFAATAADSLAQMSQEEVAIIQNVYGMEKRAIYIQVMDMSPSDSVAFWPLYDEFEMKRQDLGKRRVKNMERFVAKYPAISSEELNEIAETAIEIREDLLELEEEYYEEIKEAASTMTAAKWLQIEAFLNTVVQAQLSVRMPFIGEFHEVKAPAKK